MDKNKRKKLIRVVVVVLLFLFLLFILIRFFWKIPLLPQTPVSIREGEQTLEVIKPIPPELDTGSPNIPVSITFENSVNREDLNMTIYPPHEVEFKVFPANPNVLVVVPKKPWDFEKEYTIMVNGLVKSTFTLHQTELQDMTGPEPTLDNRQRIPQDTTKIPFTPPTPIQR